MNFVRSTLYHGTASLFKILLATVPFVFAISMTLGNPSTVEGILKQSGLYEQYPKIAISDAQKQASTADSKQVLADPSAQKAVTDALSPQLLEQSAGSFIQGIYGWLNGKTTEPEFSIDLSQAKAGVASNLATYAQNRAAGLAPCTYAQLRTLSRDIDPLSLPCLPPNVTQQQIGQQVSQQVLSGSDFLKDPVVTNETVKKANNGVSPTDQFSAAPKIYQAVQAGKWALLGLTAVLGAALIFARKDRLAGLRHVGLSLLAVGLILGVALLAFWLFFNQLRTGNPHPGSVEQIAFNGGKALVSALDKVVIIFTGAYIVGGAGMLVWLQKLGGSIRTTK